jgi:hypothetical protein
VAYDAGTELYSYTCVSCSYDLLSLTSSTTRLIANVNYAYPYLLSVSKPTITVPFVNWAADYSSAFTDIIITQNNIDMTDFFELHVSASDGITGVLSGNRYTITSFTGVMGTLIITAMKGDITLTKTVDVTYSGSRTAPDVKWATDISLAINPAVVSLINTEVIGSESDVIGDTDYVLGSPNVRNIVITASASLMYIDGSSYTYAGRFVILADSNIIYTSTEDETSCTKLIGVNALSVTVKLYEAGGTMNLVDTQTMGIIKSGTDIVVFAKNGHLAYIADADGYVNASTKTIEVVAYKGLDPINMFLWVKNVPSGFNIAVSDNIVYVTALAGSTMPESGSIRLSIGYYYVIGDTNCVLGDADYVFGLQSVSEEDEVDINLQYDKVYLL